MASLCRMMLANATYLNRCLCMKVAGQPEVQRFILTTVRPAPLSFNKECYSKVATNENETEDNSAPVRFTTSDAAKWKAEYSRRGEGEDDTPPSQPFVVIFSIAAFLIYFCILREENDIDIKIRGGPLQDPYINLEEIQLRVIVEEDAKYNRITKPEVLKRLEEIDLMKLQVAQ